MYSNHEVHYGGYTDIGFYADTNAFITEIVYICICLL